MAVPTPVFGTPTYWRDTLAQLNEAVTTVIDRGQRYQIGDRMLWRGDLEWVFSRIKEVEPKAARELLAAANCGRTGPRVRRVVPL